MMQKDMTKSANISALIANLGSTDGLRRNGARVALKKIGEPAVEPLIKALEVEDGYFHWEIIKTLSQIASPKSTQTLVIALEDDQFGIRWLAAEGLIAIGYDGLGPLLEALEKRSDSIWLREGAHHILHDLITKKLLDPTTIQHLSPVLDALNYVEPAIQIPWLARKAQQALKE